MKMLTQPVGEHLLNPALQGDVQWENQGRRKRNRQNLCDLDDISCGGASQEKKPAGKIGLQAALS